MAIFYHLLSIGMLEAGSALVTKLIPEYVPPSFPVSLSLAISSGPLEEHLQKILENTKTTFMSRI